jgi:hypothetical protein
MRSGPRCAAARGKGTWGLDAERIYYENKLQFGGTYRRSEIAKGGAVVLGPLEHKLATKFMRQNACGGE